MESPGPGIAEHYHPGTRQWAGPHSRAHSDHLDSGIAPPSCPHGRTSRSTLIPRELVIADGRICLDGVCYLGPRRSFDPAGLGAVVVVAGLEVLSADQPPAASGPRCARRTGKLSRRAGPRREGRIFRLPPAHDPSGKVDPRRC